MKILGEISWFIAQSMNAEKGQSLRNALSTVESRHTLQTSSTNRKIRLNVGASIVMKLVALGFAALGIITALFFALGPWLFGTPTGALSTFIGPFVVGSALCAIHGFTLQRIRARSGKRGGLFVWNCVTLVFMMLGAILARRYSIGGPYADVVFVLLGVLYILPLASNVVFLAVNGRAETNQDPAAHAADTSRARATSSTTSTN